jgi:FixJ family two-component response regulator
LGLRDLEDDLPEPLVSVIDDDDAVRSSLHLLLHAFGFRVSAFASAEAYLGSPERGETACLISDVCLPGGMSGAELAAHLEQGAEATPIILISGHETAAGLRIDERRDVVGFLQKPFAADVLIDCVSAALA